MMKNFAELAKLISQGVYVISVDADGKRNAFTAAWVMQVSFNPLLICFSINPEHYSYQLLEKTGDCCISVLRKDQLSFARHFSRSDIKDKMAGICWQETKGNAPALSDCLAYFSCKVKHYADAGDHKIAVCELIDAEALNEGLPMLYSDTENMDNSQELY